MTSEYQKSRERLEYLENKRHSSATLTFYAEREARTKSLTNDIEFLRKEMKEMRENLCFPCGGSGYKEVASKFIIFKTTKKVKCEDCLGLGHTYGLNKEVMNGIFEVKK